jgi:hypothetical protein
MADGKYAYGGALGFICLLGHLCILSYYGIMIIICIGALGYNYFQSSNQFPHEGKKP